MAMTMMATTAPTAGDLAATLFQRRFLMAVRTGEVQYHDIPARLFYVGRRSFREEVFMACKSRSWLKFEAGKFVLTESGLAAIRSKITRLVCRS